MALPPLLTCSLNSLQHHLMNLRLWATRAKYFIYPIECCLRRTTRLHRCMEGTIPATLVAGHGGLVRLVSCQRQWRDQNQSLNHTTLLSCRNTTITRSVLLFVMRSSVTSCNDMFPARGSKSPVSRCMQLQSKPRNNKNQIAG